MMSNFILLVLFTFEVIVLVSFFLIEAYINLFQAEKIRRLLISQPEYNPGWYTLITSYKPFKWWHFYRKQLFSFVTSISLSGEAKTECEKATRRIMPRHVQVLYKIELYFIFPCLIPMVIFGVVSSFK